ncbi:MAG: EI24 domain-containing protein [Salinibacterium sp.]|nr:EI24 domain-containing protein [Salinibacterium sp.]
MVLGLIPAVIVAAALTIGLVILAINVEWVASAVTPFADNWDRIWRDIARVAIAIAFVVAAILLVSFTFTTITLIVGQPFYELVWRHAESRFGLVPAKAPGFWKATGLGLINGLRMLIPTILIGIVLFALGLVPIVGVILAAILGAFVGGWLLALELTGLAFDARGLTFAQRRAALRARRPLALGFGAAAYLLFLVPLGAVFVMPAAVAGSVLLTRRTLGEDSPIAVAQTAL